MGICLRTMKASRSASPIMAGLLLLTACSQQQMSATSPEEQREKAACAQVRQQQPELVQRFVQLWAPPLLEVDFQRQFTTNTELPARYDPAQFGDLTETEELGLASCLAEELAALQLEPPPNAPIFNSGRRRRPQRIRELFHHRERVPAVRGSLECLHLRPRRGELG